MTFSQRLLKYLMGVSLSLVFIAMAFGPRAFSCNYFPNARVLEEATAKKMRFSDQAIQFFDQEKLDSVFYKKELFGRSKIDFDKSLKNAVPCRTYYADYTSKDETKKYHMVFKVCKETSELVSINKR